MTTNLNFDWSQTNIDLLFLIPNYGRGNYIRKIIDNLTNTSIPKDKWIILIINDGREENFDDLKDKNVLYFTIERGHPWERGDGFTRNIAIKYSKSNLLAQKDPEIYYTGDFIKGCFDHMGELYRCGGLAHLSKKQDTELFMNDQISINEIQQRAQKYPITERHVYYHFGYCIQREILVKLGGYDESYKYYAYADTDLFDRLMKFGVKQFVDKSIQPIHLFHNKPDTKNDSIAIKRELINRRLYESKKNESIIRNIGVDWGTGDLSYKPEII